jgi:hypothetical protein
MANRTCVGCCEKLTTDLRSREHILPQWLAQEVKRPDLDLKHYRHHEDENTDELLRSHDLGSFVVKNVCIKCNNGWMSRLEGRAKPLLLDLMNMRASLLQLSTEDRTTVSAWAIKTAFMIASAQKSTGTLPWYLFRRLAEEPENVPAECLVLAAQLLFLPRDSCTRVRATFCPNTRTPSHGLWASRFTSCISWFCCHCWKPNG